MTIIATPPRTGAPRTGAAGRAARLALVLALLAGLLAGPARAQTTPPAWDAALGASMGQTSGTSQMLATALNATGEVLVAGSFSGSVAFGSTVLLSAGSNDLFVAKYQPATGTWAWAYRGGGTSSDQALGLAVSGAAVYVTGIITNTLANASSVTLDGGGNPAATVRGTSSANNGDLMLARYTDAGSSATLAWVQVGGGIGTDRGSGVAVSGSSLYVTGYLTNNLGDAGAVRLGSDGTATTNTAPGLVAVRGTSSTNGNDLLLAKYTDNTTSAALTWTQVGGGIGTDQGNAVAVSGSSVYVAGNLGNSLNDANNARFNSDGTATTNTAPGLVTVRGTTTLASGYDLLLAKYTDNGLTGSFNWSQVGGGTGVDLGLGVAVSGSSVYVTGYIGNNLNDASTVRFGSDGTATTNSAPGLVTVRGASSSNGNDLLLARYTDNGLTGSFNWTQVGGGTSSDQGNAVAVSGSSVYVTGYIYNTAADANTVRFGGDGSTATPTGLTAVPGASPTATTGSDVVLAKYTDNTTSGAFGWAQVGGGGGFGTDLGAAVAASGTSVYVGGYVSSPNPTFGTAVGSPVRGTSSTASRAVLAELTDAGPSGTWTRVSAAFNGGTSQVQATAANAAGEVLVAGTFTGQVYVGSTLLSSADGNDLFVAKYQPATGTWAWAYRGGGTSSDQAQGLAVSGTAVYVTGTVSNDLANSAGVTLDGGSNPAATVRGTSSNSSNDLLLARYTDAGSSAALAWTQVGGGTNTDQGNAVAVSGSSLYVVGYLGNNLGDASAVRLGSDGTATTNTAPGLMAVRGTSSTNGNDLLLAKYTDNTTSATYNWAQVGGGIGVDQGTGVAVSGSSVYVAGFITNTLADGNAVRLGSDGTATTNSAPGLVAVRGASSTNGSDLLLAKYTDNLTSAALAWTQVGGGTSNDQGRALALSGSSVYVAGYTTNTATDANAVRFGGDGTTATPTGLTAVPGASPTASTDVLLARYTDNATNGAFSWAQVGGGTGNDQGLALALGGQQVYAAGVAVPVATFGSTTLAQPVGGSSLVLARLTDATLSPLPVQLVAFTAQVAGPTAVQLAWATASELNSAAFEVQRSPDGTAWQVLATVQAAGSSASLRRYAFLDEAAPAGTSYYRLRQLDQDGTSAYSATRTVVLGPAGLSVYPNPAAGATTLAGAVPGTTVQALDALGRVAATAAVGPDGTARLAGLATGLYLLRCGAATVRLAVE